MKTFVLAAIVMMLMTASCFHGMLAMNATVMNAIIVPFTVSVAILVLAYCVKMLYVYNEKIMHVFTTSGVAVMACTAVVLSTPSSYTQNQFRSEILATLVALMCLVNIYAISWIPLFKDEGSSQVRRLGLYLIEATVIYATLMVGQTSRIGSVTITMIGITAFLGLLRLHQSSRPASKPSPMPSLPNGSQ